MRWFIDSIGEKVTERLHWIAHVVYCETLCDLVQRYLMQIEIKPAGGFLAK